MNEMIERVARALCEALTGEMSYVPVAVNLECAARAAIAAMREPTEDMAMIGRLANEYEYGDSESGWGTGTVDPTGAWQAMIDAVLYEEEA